MRKLSLILAAAAVVLALAVSGSASAEDGSHKILSQGKILMKSSTGDDHHFTVVYDEKIYSCRTWQWAGEWKLECNRLKDVMEGAF